MFSFLISFLAKEPIGAKIEGRRVIKATRFMETNVPIAAAVTAYSRMIINDLKLVALNGP
jgi:hypothetical protein